MNEALVYQAHYTKSDPILNYMTGMLDFHPHDSILEPCGGDGVFVDKILEKEPKANICIYELNPKAVLGLKDKYRGETNIRIKETDTLLDDSITSCSIRYDKIIGNPPYGARNDEKKKDLLNKLYADLYTKESYTLFLYACTRCLNENGELSFIIPDTFLSLHRHLAIRKYLLTNTKIKELALFPSSFFPGINFGYANLCIITLKRSSNVAQNLRNEISIRTNFKTVDELEIDGCGTRKTISQKDVIEGVGSAFMFNSTDKITELINDDSIQKIGDIASCVTGFYSGNDKDYLHPISTEIKNAKKYVCADSESIHTSQLTDTEKSCGIATTTCLVPVVKGGNIEFVKPNHWFMDWSTKAIKEYKSSKKCRFQNSDYYFKNGIGIPMIRSSKLTGALIEGRLFDQSIVGVFPKDEKWVLYLLGFFNSAVCTELINAINPSTNNSANYIKKIPFIVPSDETKNQVDRIIGEIVRCLKNGNEQIESQKAELDEVFANLYFKKIGINQNSSKRVMPKQLNFLDMLDLFEGVNSEATMVCEDEPVGYGRYRAPMYPTEFHEKFYIARGNVFDVESFWADGVAAFVKGGFNNISASYDEFKSTPHEGVHVAEYLYNNPGTNDPTPENVNDLVAGVLNSLVEKGAKVITMPPINFAGVKAEVKDALTAQAVVAWLKDNGEKINRLIIVDKEA